MDTRTKGRYSAYTTMSGPEISEATLDEDVEELFAICLWLCFSHYMVILEQKVTSSLWATGKVIKAKGLWAGTHVL